MTNYMLRFGHYRVYEVPATGNDVDTAMTAALKLLQTEGLEPVSEGFVEVELLENVDGKWLSTKPDADFDGSEWETP